MCVVSHGVGEVSTSPMIAPHSRVHTSHGCLDLHGHSARHRPHTAGIWGIHAPGAPWEGLGWVGYMVIPALTWFPPPWSVEVSIAAVWFPPIPAPTLHNLGHPHIHFPLWKVVKVITSLTTPVCKLMQNCDPSHTPFFYLLKYTPRGRLPGATTHHTTPAPTGNTLSSRRAPAPAGSRHAKRRA